MFNVNRVHTLSLCDDSLSLFMMFNFYALYIVFSICFVQRQLELNRSMKNIQSVLVLILDKRLRLEIRGEWIACSQSSSLFLFGFDRGIDDRCWFDIRVASLTASSIECMTDAVDCMLDLAFAGNFCVLVSVSPPSALVLLASFQA